MVIHDFLRMYAARTEQAILQEIKNWSLSTTLPHYCGDIKQVIPSVQGVFAWKYSAPGDFIISYNVT